MKQKIVDQAMAVIREKRRAAEEEAKANLVCAMKIEEFQTAYNAFVEAKIENAKNEAFGENNNSNIEKAKENLKKVIKKHNLAPITTSYSCPKCKDNGTINGEYCSCLKREMARILISQSGFNKLESFDKSNFNIFEDKEKAQKIYALLQKWCSAQTEKTSVYICGCAGTGKTYLTKCMANELISQGIITQILTAFALNQKFLAIHTSSEDEKAALTSELLSVEALFIDDLGTEPVYRNVTREYLYLLINERQSRGLRTVITSNLYPEDVRDRYDERIFSRLMDKSKSIVIEMRGKDLRIEKQKN